MSMEILAQIQPKKEGQRLQLFSTTNSLRFYLEI